ncbi:TPA: hypothetical protein DCL37_00265 [Candidatus Acetothermia bacterium]|nr:hypothetical protein [Candidatus Acetothermia bacterium]
MKLSWVGFARLWRRPKDLGLVGHAQAVENAAQELGKQLRAWLRAEAVNSELVSEAEHAADRVKRELRAKLTSSRWLPIPRSSLLELIWHQDEIADLCQDAALLMALRRPELSIELVDGFRTVGESLARAVHEYRLVVESFEEAVTGGASPERLKDVQEGVDRINLVEHESDMVERELVRAVYGAEGLSDFDRYHLVQLVLLLGGVVDQTENAAGDLRLLVSRFKAAAV